LKRHIKQRNKKRKVAAMANQVRRQLVTLYAEMHSGFKSFAVKSHS